MSPLTKQTKHIAAESSQQTGTNSNETPEILNKNGRIERVAIEPSANVTPNDLLRLAIQSNADLDRLDKLMELQMKWEANQARKAYVAAMTGFRSRCPAIGRTKTVAFGTRPGATSYKYAPLGVTIDKIKATLSDCGLSHSWRMTQQNGSISVTCRVTHLQGHSEETTMTAPPDTSGSKNSIQAIASTATYLERYTLFALLGLAPQDMDDDAQGTGEPQEPVSQQRLIDMLIRDACKQYGDKKRPVLSADSEIDPGKFKEQLRSHFSALPDEQRKKFEWNKNSIDSLAAKMDVNKVIVKRDSTDGT